MPADILNADGLDTSEGCIGDVHDCCIEGTFRKY